MSSVPLKYPARDRRVCRDRRVVAGGAGGKLRGGANEGDTFFIPLLLIILLLADTDCVRTAASGHEVGASSRAAGAALGDDGDDDCVSSCDDRANGAEVAVKPKPTRVDCCFFDCFFVIFTGFPKLQLKLI